MIKAICDKCSYEDILFPKDIVGIAKLIQSETKDFLILCKKCREGIQNDEKGNTSGMDRTWSLN